MSPSMDPFENLLNSIGRHDVTTDTMPKRHKFRLLYSKVIPTLGDLYIP